MEQEADQVLHHVTPLDQWGASRCQVCHYRVVDQRSCGQDFVQFDVDDVQIVLDAIDTVLDLAVVPDLHQEEDGLQDLAQVGRQEEGGVFDGWGRGWWHWKRLS